MLISAVNTRLSVSYNVIELFRMEFPAMQNDEIIMMMVKQQFANSILLSVSFVSLETK